MAENVRFYLEAMLPDLQDMMNQKIFDQNEIKEIIKTREMHEYRLKRRVPKQLDYLRYIQSELNLEYTRRERKILAGIKSNKAQSEPSVIKNIHHIFNRALKKFKGDKVLWLQYIDFCKRVESGRVLGRVYASAIQSHPLEEGFWIIAAEHEFEGNGNVGAARNLLQRALRLKPESENLWLQFFKLEVMFWEKICQRKEILLGGTKKIDDSDSVFVPKLEGEGEDDGDEAMSFDDGAVPQTIFTFAVKALGTKTIPKFLQIVKDSIYSKKLEKTILGAIQKDFPDYDHNLASNDDDNDGKGDNDNSTCEPDSLAVQPIFSIPTDISSNPSKTRQYCDKYLSTNIGSQDMDAWMVYIGYEYGIGEWKRADLLIWKAKEKFKANSELFISKLEELKQKIF